MSKKYLFGFAVEIAKEHAASGNSRSVELVLRQAYEELKKMAADVGDQ